MRTHYFNEDLKRGEYGENLLLNRYSYLTKDSTDGHDMIDTRGEPPITIEVKTDSHDMDIFPNFFMETYSDDKSHKLGGPWRSADHNTDVFLYHFKNNFRIFWFDNIPLLVTKVETYMANYNPREIKVKNAGYNTLGYKIPRDVLAEICTELEFGDTLPIKQERLVTGK